jgi:hypothetical protein
MMLLGRPRPTPRQGEVPLILSGRQDASAWLSAWLVLPAKTSLTETFSERTFTIG